MHSDKNILVVDDESRNVKLMKALLMPMGYRVQTALSGPEAIAITETLRPDLVLLDIMMPDMDGFEVCRRVKENAATRPIPVIMVTALHRMEDRVKAMEAGADDFLSKPVDATELSIRVKSLLRIKAYQDDLETSYSEIAEKSAELASLHQMKEQLMHMIVHDLNNPLANITWGLELLSTAREELPGAFRGLIDGLVCSCRDVNDMVQNILDVYKMEEGKLAPVKKTGSLEGLIREVVSLFDHKAQERGIFITCEADASVPAVPMDAVLIKRVLANLLNNAIRYTPSGGTVSIALVHLPEEGGLCIRVCDSGRGLAEEYHEKIFDKFEQIHLRVASGRSGGHGLGLAFCRMAVEAHEGRIWLESHGDGRGCTFCFTLPLVESASLSEISAR